VKPPVLASDILREEVAPKRPARRAIRVWLIAFAATFAVGALAARPGFGAIAIPGDAAFAGAIATSALAALVAILPLPYATRAALAAVTGLVPLALGALGLGPLAAFGGAGAWEAATAIPLVTLLPAALVFRARYRAFAGARAILGVALALSVPALVLLALAAADGGAPIADRVASGAAVAAAMTALFGFMGPETSAGCSRWAALVVVAHTMRLAVAAGAAALAANAGDIGGGGGGGGAGSGVEASALSMATGFAAAALGELIASMLVTFALFQIAAAIWAERARQVDVHRIVGAGAPSSPGELKERE